MTTQPLTRTQLVATARISEVMLPLIGQPSAGKLFGLMADMLEDDQRQFLEINRRPEDINRKLAAEVVLKESGLR